MLFDAAAFSAALTFPICPCAWKPSAGAGFQAASSIESVGMWLAEQNYASVNELTHQEMIVYIKLAALILYALTVTGCNTIEGAGKDIERGGEKLQDAAAKKKSD